MEQAMIERFQHKGLRLLFEKDDRKVRADQAARIRLILAALDAAGRIEDMNQPTFRLHPLKGNRKGAWIDLMKPVADKLTEEDMLNLAAYAASRPPQ